MEVADTIFDGSDKYRAAMWALHCDAENISLWRKEVEELQILESAMKRAYVAVNGVEQDRAHHQISAVVERLQLLERKLKVARDGCGPHDTVGFFVTFEARTGEWNRCCAYLDS